MRRRGGLRCSEVIVDGQSCGQGGIIIIILVYTMLCLVMDEREASYRICKFI